MSNNISKNQYFTSSGSLREDILNDPIKKIELVDYIVAAKDLYSALTVIEGLDRADPYLGYLVSVILDPKNKNRSNVSNTALQAIRSDKIMNMEMVNNLFTIIEENNNLEAALKLFYSLFSREGSAEICLRAVRFLLQKREDVYHKSHISLIQDLISFVGTQDSSSTSHIIKQIIDHTMILSGEVDERYLIESVIVEFSGIALLSELQKMVTLISANHLFIDDVARKVLEKEDPDEDKKQYFTGFLIKK